MLVFRPTIAAFIAAAAVSEAAQLRLGQRHLQTYTQSNEYSYAMLKHVNDARAEKGLDPLCINKKLQNAAQEHSDDQAANNFLDHEGTDGTKISDRVAQAGYDWDSVAENIAAGQPNVDSAMTTWLKSPGHLENILGNYTMFGCAYAYNADSEFQHYWTQDFGTGDAEECDSATSEPETEVADIIASSEEEDNLVLTDVIETESTEVVEDPPLMATTTEETEDVPETDAPVVIDGPEILWTSAPEKVYETHDTPSVQDPATYAPHKDCGM